MRHVSVGRAPPVDTANLQYMARKSKALSRLGELEQEAADRTKEGQKVYQGMKNAVFVCSATKWTLPLFIK